MRQEGAREDSPTRQKDQSSKKEEGTCDTDHQLKRHGVREKFRESQSEQRIQIITGGTTRQREEGY